MLDVACSSKVSSTSQLSCPLVSSEISSTESEKDNLERLNFLLFVVSSISKSMLSALLISNASCSDSFDLIEVFDIVELIEVCLDLGMNTMLEVEQR